MAYIYDIADTWAASGTTFTGIKLNVTDTASAAGSLLMDLQVGGSSRFSVTKAGNVSLNNAQNLTIATDFVLDHYVQLYANSRIYPGGNGIIAVAGSLNRHAALGLSGLTLSSTDGLGWSSVGGWGLTAATPDRDLLLLRDAANTLAQRNGVNAQAFNLYNTYTDASNYERFGIRWSNNDAIIGIQVAGTGTFRQLHHVGATHRFFVGANGATFAWNIENTGNLVAQTGVFVGLTEMTAPPAPAANGVRIYAEDNGSGKTRLMAVFTTGAAQQIAIEP